MSNTYSKNSAPLHTHFAQEIETPFLSKELFSSQSPVSEVRTNYAAESPLQGSPDDEPLNTNEQIRLETTAVMEEGLLPQSPSDKCKKAMGKLKIAVVGAGFAGLMAARQLRLAGANVTVFEAREEVGGRVKSNKKDFPGRVIEEGAELVGSFHTQWRELAITYGISFISRMERGLYGWEGLNMKLKLDKELSMEEIEAVEKDVEDRLSTMANDAAEVIEDPARPWVTSNPRKLREREQFDNMSVAQALKQKYQVVEGTRLWKMLTFLLVNNEVGLLEEMNFLGLLCKIKAGQISLRDKPFTRFLNPPRAKEQKEIDDKYERKMRYWHELEVFRCANGCQELALQMAKKTIGLSNIKRRTAVTQIHLGSAKVKVTYRLVISYNNKKPTYGKPYSQEYDYVILAVPPTAWRYISITAEDPGDRKLQNVDLEKEIGHIGMGPAVKLFSDVKERFWISKKLAPLGGSLNIGQVWEGTDNQMQVGNQTIVLNVFAGPVVNDGGKQRTPNKQEIVNGLQDLYPDYKPAMAKIFSDWPNETFIETGYAAPKIGQIFTIKDKLWKPFRDRLYFAGEHTQMDTFGYMEGALRSGERVAEAIRKKVCGLDIPDQANLAEATFEKTVVEQENAFTESRWQEEYALNEWENEEVLEAEKAWDGMEDSWSVFSKGQEANEFLNSADVPLPEGETEYNSTGDVAKFYSSVREDEL
jgi:monoamine oxidase